MGWWNVFAENPNPIFEFTQSWLEHVHTCRTSKGKLGTSFFKTLLKYLCMPSFWMRRKGNKFEIKLPDINLLKL